MTDKQLQAKMDKAVRLLSEIGAEAKRRYPGGYLYCECGESLNIMSCADEGTLSERQEAVVMSAHGIRNMDCGAW